jgi:hypothetical protein
MIKYCNRKNKIKVTKCVQNFGWKARSPMRKRKGNIKVNILAIGRKGVNLIHLSSYRTAVAGFCKSINAEEDVDRSAIIFPERHWPMELVR